MDKERHCLDLEEVDETAEILEEQADQVMSRGFKEMKKKTPLLKNGRSNFNSGEYYMIKDLQKMRDEKIKEVVSKQSEEMESKYGNGEKKSGLFTDKDKTV